MNYKNMLFKKLQEAKNRVACTGNEYAHTCNILENYHICDLPELFNDNFDNVTNLIDIVKKYNATEPLKDNTIESSQSKKLESTEQECERTKEPEFKYKSVYSFLEKYANFKSEDVQQIRKDLITILSDIQFIKKYNLENTQWALDFVDALNELSVSF